MPIIRLLKTVAVVIAAFVLFASDARAQGTRGEVPEPLSTVELHRLLYRYVQPTKAQWDAIESVHDDYREAFRQLRETDIEKFMGEMAGMESSGVPSPKLIEEVLRKYERLTKRIEELDGTLMDGIAAIVGDEKRAAVDRTRDARARARDGTSNLGDPFGAAFDLSALVLDGLDSLQGGEKDKDAAATRATIDPTLITYEKRLTTLMHSMSDESRRMMVDLVKELEKQGFTNLSDEDLNSDPEKMQHLMESLQAAWKSAGARVAKVSAEMRELHSTTFKLLMGQMHGDAARQLRVRFVGRIYPELAMSGLQPERLYRSFLRSSRLDADAKARVKTEYDAWAQADDAIVDHSMRKADEFAKTRNPMDFAAPEMEDSVDDLQNDRAKREELAKRAVENLRAIVGEERLEKLAATPIDAANEDVFDDTSDPDAEAPGLAVPGADGEIDELDRDSRVETPIAVSTVQALVNSMKLDDSSKATLETLHSDYLKRWEEEIKPLSEAMVSAQTGIFTTNADDSVRMDVAKQSLYYENRRALAEAAATVDSSFFDDAGKAIGSTHARELLIAKLNRAVDRYTQPNQVDWMMDLGDGSPQSVSLPTLIEQVALPEEVRAQALDVLAAHAEAIAASYHDSYFEALELERQVEMMQTKWRENANAGDEAGAIAAANNGAQMIALQQSLGKLVQRRVALSDEAFTAMLEAVGDEHKQRLQFEHDKMAYPSVFADPSSAMPILDKADALHDLTDDQRIQLKALRDVYGKEYLDACRRMLPKPIEVSDSAKPEQRFAAQMEQANSRAKIQFERDERSARAVSQIRRILDEKQQKQIPILTNYEKSLGTQGAQGLW